MSESAFGDPAMRWVGIATVQFKTKNWSSEWGIPSIKTHCQSEVEGVTPRPFRIINPILSQYTTSSWSFQPTPLATDGVLLQPLPFFPAL